MDEIYGDEALERGSSTRAWVQHWPALERGSRQQTMMNLHELARAHDLPRQQTMTNLHELARGHDLPNLELAYKAAEAEIAQQEAEYFFS